ncbi:FecR domain-containing protein [Azomonas macrocytogenes]|uniref:Transmembrane sensor n=1 Tax=Azomonas macrocytogenes TaxID=69962 RepID=A0A839T5T4_AZOMA|nr:FecR domain-containing protein [Azomonas macrocytogenes]MBB3103846.1 transmembrane sensor [Azomonas macrocytogenes]
MSRKPDHAALQQAAQWYARLSADPADQATRVAWQQWHGQHEMHRLAWQYVERVSQRFASLQDDSVTAAQTLRSARRAGISRRQTLRSLTLLAGGSLLGWIGWRVTPLPQLWMAWRADYHTGTGEIRDLMLADGTHLWLNSASALNVDYRADVRQLRLLTGEILIDTAHEARPFIVATAQGRLRALGTRFSVTQQDGHTLLAVFDGAVEVRTAGSAATHIVQAGRQLRFDNQAIGPEAPAQQTREAWTQGMLLVNDIPLAEFIEELNRYRHGYLGVSPQIAGLRVMGTYPLHDTEQILSMLESALPIRIQRTLPWWTSIEAR